MTPRDTAIADAAAQASLQTLGYPSTNLITPRAGIDHDVAVIGGGQSGVAIAYGLRRAGVTNTTVVDAGRDENDTAWRARARMLTLRTSKTVSGPELGNPALTFRAWYNGIHGPCAFDSIDRIATTDWADYLTWFTRHVGVKVRRTITVTNIEPADAGHIRLHMESGGHRWTEHTRKVVLATGVAGTGTPYVPAVLAGLTRGEYAHTADAIDFPALHGASVAVVGAGASAFDAAATALEAHAADVHLYARRRALNVATSTGIQSNPLLQNVFHLRPDNERWQLRSDIAARGASVPAESVARAASHANYHLHLASTVTSITERGGQILVETAHGTRRFDFIIAGTGYQHDPTTRPELTAIAPQIARWSDIYPGVSTVGESDTLSTAPYLGSGYHFTERHPGTSPWLADIHVFSNSAHISFGRPVGDIPSLQNGIPRLINALTTDLIMDDLHRTRSTTTTSTQAPKTR